MKKIFFLGAFLLAIIFQVKVSALSIQVDGITDNVALTTAGLPISDPLKCVINLKYSSDNPSNSKGKIHFVGAQKVLDSPLTFAQLDLTSINSAMGDIIVGGPSSTTSCVPEDLLGLPYYVLVAGITVSDSPTANVAVIYITQDTNNIFIQFCTHGFTAPVFAACPSASVNPSGAIEFQTLVPFTGNINIVL
jgi:hypothetical protein